MAYYPKSTSSNIGWGKFLRYKLSDLPLHQKLVGIGSLISIIGVLLPWISYDDHTRNGLQDITFLVGYIIIFLSALVLLSVILKMTKKKFLKFPLRETLLSLFTGTQIVLLSVISFSIYSQLFLYTSSSQIRFGLTFSGIGGLMILIGSYLAYKEEKQDAVKKTFLHHLPEEEEQDQELEQFFQKSKEKHNTLEIEESSPKGKITYEDNQKKDENMSMFDGHS